MRLCEGGEFGMVLAELRPVTGHNPSSPSPYNEAEGRGLSTSELLESTGPQDVPDDPSQPVSMEDVQGIGRITYCFGDASNSLLSILFRIFLTTSCFRLQFQRSR